MSATPHGLELLLVVFKYAIVWIDQMVVICLESITQSSDAWAQEE